MTVDLEAFRLRVLALTVALALGLIPPAAWADAAAVAPPEAQTPSAPAAPAEHSLPADAVSKHTIEIDGVPLVYEATVGMLPLAGPHQAVKAHVGFTSYVRVGDAHGRPIAFVFNGGPGASSVYLHLGALGPRTVALNPDGTMPPPPVQLVTNPRTWLAFTDLVFVDPVGTGFSRPARAGGRSAPSKEFWGVDKDLEWNAQFIREYLTRAQRWTSPKFLIGESYGGFRAARLAAALPVRHGIGVNGVVLVSPVLEFALMSGDERFTLWPLVLRLPSYAATAWHHGRVGGEPRDPAARDRFLQEVEAFSLTEVLPQLAQGRGLPADRRQAIYSRMAELTGLPLATIERAEGRISRETFVKEVLAAEGRVIGRYDASVSIPDPNPASPRFVDTDPTLGGLTAPMTSAANAYLRGELGYDIEVPYIVLNRAVSREWEWGSGRDGAPGAADELRAAMVTSPALKVLIAHGRLDLVTPYFASEYVASQMRLAPPLLDNLSLALYDGGHMMYLNRDAREALFRDARKLFGADRPGG